MRLFRPSPTEFARPHERVFLERYGQIVAWALKLTHGDQAHSHDLTHDAFIQFTLSMPDLEAIQNLDSYLYGMLRNLHISYLRKASRDSLQTLTPSEFDSIYLVLATDRNTPLDIQNELRQICAFACQRKEVSKSGSILILRFFYDYLPKEIGDIALLNPPAVYNLLLTARREVSRAKQLNWEPPADRARSQKPNESVNVRAKLRGRAVLVDSLLGELREMLLAARRGPCLSAEKLLAPYRKASAEPVDCSILAHLVSCQRCLDILNDFMKRPRIDQRVPGESMDTDQPPDNGDTSKDKKSMLQIVVSSRSLKDRYSDLYAVGLRRREQVFQHWPTQLSIAVNGELQASHAIQAESSELKAHIDRSIHAEFVEVFSEQGLRLLMVSVADAPPEGPHERHLAAELSGGRQLGMILEFGSRGLSITVRYHDPEFAAIDAERIEERRDAFLVLPNGGAAPSGSSRWPVRLSLPHELLAYLMPSTGWALAAALGLIAVVGSVFYSHRGTNHLDARALLDRAVAEEKRSVVVGRAEHRILRIERIYRDGSVTTVGHTDVWHSGRKLAQRFYDNRGRFVAGDWADAQSSWSYDRADGIKTQRSESLNVAPTPTDIWRIEPKAEQFSRTVAGGALIRATEEATEYTLSSSELPQPISEPHLVRLSLAMTRTGLHAHSETMWFSDGEVYRVVETSYDLPKESGIDPDTFHPNASLRRPVQPSAPRDPRRASTNESSLIHLELQVLAALNAIGADIGDPITVTRDSSREGRLVHVSGIVDTAERKEQVLAALASLPPNPSLRISLSAPEDQRVQVSNNRLAAPTSVKVFDTTDDNIPAYDDLREHFERHGYRNQELDNHVRGFCFAVLQQSSAASQQAWAIRRLTDAFAPDELAHLDNESRVLWLKMLESHAREFNRNITQLQTSLALIYPEQALPNSDKAQAVQSVELDNLQQLISATQILFNQTLRNDETIRSAFSHTNSPDKAAALKTTRFHVALAQTEQTAGAVFAVTGKLESWASLHGDSK